MLNADCVPPFSVLFLTGEEKKTDGSFLFLCHHPLSIGPGGHRGFSKVVWTVKEHVGGGDSPYITLYYHSFDGEQGTVCWLWLGWAGSSDPIFCDGLLAKP